MASGDTKTEALLNVLGNGGDASQYEGCCNTKTQGYILNAINRIQGVEDEVEELKNNPDVVDIVDTYADLQAYDTQHLTENDVIRVLQDETHSGNSTYYRFTKNPDTWTFVGEISGGGGGALAIDLTTDDYNANSSNWSDTDPTHFDCVAVWKLAEGMYKKTNASVNAYMNKTKTNFGTDALLIVGKAGNYGKPLIRFRGGSNSPDGASYGDYRLSNDGSDGSSVYTLYKPIDDLTHQATSAPLSANQGYVLKGLIDNAGVKQLTSDDYNYPTNNPNTIALWLLEPGLYHINGSGINVSTDKSGSQPQYNNYYYLILKDGGGTTIIYRFTTGYLSPILVFGCNNTGTSSGSYYNVMTTNEMQRYAQVITGSGAPSTSTGERRGQIYIDTDTNDGYLCVSRSGSTRIWKQITQ